MLQSYANLSMADMQDSLPEPEAMEGDALSSFHVQWEGQLREKAALEEGVKLEVTLGIMCIVTSGLPHVVWWSVPTIAMVEICPVGGGFPIDSLCL